MTIPDIPWHLYLFHIFTWASVIFCGTFSVPYFFPSWHHCLFIYFPTWHPSTCLFTLLHLLSFLILFVYFHPHGILPTVLNPLNHPDFPLLCAVLPSLSLVPVGSHNVTLGTLILHLAPFHQDLATFHTSAFSSPLSSPLSCRPLPLTFTFLLFFHSC